MKADGDDRNLLDQPYPIKLIQHACHRLRHRQRSSRRRLGHRPITVDVSAPKPKHVLSTSPSSSCSSLALFRIMLVELYMHMRRKGGLLTSGKVPLEKTLLPRTSQ